MPPESDLRTDRMLVELCGSHLRYRLFRALFEQPGRELHLRGLSALAGVESGNAHRMLKRLVEVGWVEQVRGDVYPKYRARMDTPLSRDVHLLFSRTSAFLTELKDVAQTLEGYVAVYGSVARGEESPDSDTDVLVIGPMSTIMSQAHFKPLGRKHNRRINITAATSEEVANQIRNGSLFWRDVLTGPLIELKGNIPNEVANRLSQRGEQGLQEAPGRSAGRPELDPRSRRQGQGRPK